MVEKKLICHRFQNDARIIEIESRRSCTRGLQIASGFNDWQNCLETIDPSSRVVYGVGKNQKLKGRFNVFIENALAKAN